MGRRWGKTILAGTTELVAAAWGDPCAWVVPTYRNARPVWRFIEDACRHGDKVWCELHRGERIVEFKSGGYLAVYSADNDTAMRGEKFKRIRIDEAPFVKETTWTDVIMPAMADYADAEAMLIGTPKGRNWFWRGWRYAMDQLKQHGPAAREAAWRAPSWANPMPSIRRAFLIAKERLPRRSFLQEWLARFVEDGGTVLPHVHARSTAQPQGPAPGHLYVLGLDWGKEDDWTVASVVDATTMTQVYLERMQLGSWSAQLDRIAHICSIYRPTLTVPEANSIGSVLTEALYGIPYIGNVLPWLATNLSKAKMADTFAFLLERGLATLLDDDDQKLELESLERHRLASGLYRIAAPDGMHDDTFIATGLALQMCADARGYTLDVIAGQPREMGGIVAGQARAMGLRPGPGMS